MTKRFIIDDRILNSANDQIVALVGLLCNIEYALITMGWYTEEKTVDKSTSPKLNVVALSLFLAYTGVSIHEFKKLIGKSILKKSSIWSEEIQLKWDYLQTVEVEEVKVKLFKLIRDKSTFHSDPIKVKAFLTNCVSKYDDSKVIWETNDNGEDGHSPIAALFIADSIMNATYGEDNSISGLAKKACKIFGAIRDVVLESIADFGLQLEEIETDRYSIE